MCRQICKITFFHITKKLCIKSFHVGLFKVMIYYGLNTGSLYALTLLVIRICSRNHIIYGAKVHIKNY